MRYASRAATGLAMLGLISACSAGGGGSGSAGGAAGSPGTAAAAGLGTGDASSGGATTGGHTGSGGTKATGGSSNSGGTGGTHASGGSGGSGGSIGSGGTSTSGGSGGSSETGGATNGTGGVTNTGGGATGGGTGIGGATSGWQDVTPSGIHLAPDFNSAGNFGVQDVLADPARPGTFYAFVCYQGVWKSTDFGATWVKVDTDNNLEQGRPWGEAIAPDGSYMLACTGYGTARWGAWKSTDGGVTWVKHPIADNSDPYMFDIDPNDKNHVISTSHSVGNIYESKDAGNTWTDRGDAGVGASGYAFFITSTTWLLVAQSGGGGTLRSTNSGTTWSHVGVMEHVHGGEQIFVDRQNGDIYVGSHSGTSGVYRSTDGGASFNQVSSAQSAAVFATANTLFSMDSGANLGGNPPNPHTSARSSGTTWAAISVPAGMTNGPKRADASRDPVTGKWAVVAGNWNAGIWRYVEP